jgi:ABC-type nitrate/sulfonate/bicarbonate transport system ATPase subunit
LSGGEKTRVSLARALVSMPCCLFLDEPFVGLDLMTRWGIYKVLKNVRKGLDLTTIMTSHNIPEAIVLSDRIVVIQDSEDGTVAEVIEISDDLAIDDPIACLQAARDISAPIERKILLCDY